MADNDFDPTNQIMQSFATQKTAPVLQAETPAVDPSAADPTDGIMRDAAKPSPQVFNGGYNPSDPYQGFLSFTKQLDEKMGEATQVGASGFRESALGHAVMDGRMSLEDAEQKIDDDEHMKWMSNDVDQYVNGAWNQSPGGLTNWHNWATGIPSSLGISTAKALPFWAASAAAGAGVGGVAGGAAMATGVGAPAAMPLAGLGFLAGTAGYATDYLYGHEYLARRRAGASDGDAKLWGGVSALGQGLLQAVQFRGLAKVPIDAAKVPLEMAKPALVKTIMSFGNYVGNATKFIAQQATLAEAQKAVDLMTRAIQGTVSDSIKAGQFAYGSGFKYAKPGPYATKLAPEQEQAFRKWRKTNMVPFDETPTSDYDMGGYFKDVVLQGKNETSINANDHELHFPDTYKTPYHRSFSRESKYALPNAPYWKNDHQLVDENGRVVFDEKHPLTGSVQSADYIHPTVEQAIKEFSDTFSNTVWTAAALHGLGTGLGKAVSGFTGKAFLGVVQQAHDTHMQLQAEKARIAHEESARMLQGKIEMSRSASAPAADRAVSAEYEISQAKEALSALEQDETLNYEEYQTQRKALTGAIQKARKVRRQALRDLAVEETKDLKQEHAAVAKSKSAANADLAQAVIGHSNTALALQKAKQGIKLLKMLISTETDEYKLNQYHHELTRAEKQISELTRAEMDAETKVHAAKETLRSWNEREGEVSKDLATKERAVLKRAHEDLAKALKLSLPQKSGKHIESKVDIDTSRVLAKYREFLADPEKAKAQLRDSAELKVNEAKAKDKAAVDNQIAQPLDDATREIDDIIAADTLIDRDDPAAVGKLADTIANLVDTGRQKRLEARIEQREQLKQLEQDVFDDIQGEQSHHVDLKEPFPGELSGWEQFKRMGGQQVLTWRWFVEHLTQHSKNPKSLDRLKVKDEIIESRRAIDEQDNRAVDVITDKDPQSYAFMLKLAQDGKKQRTWGEYIDQDGIKRKYNASPWEVVQDAMDMRNAEAGPGSKMYSGLSQGNRLTFRDNSLNIRPLEKGEVSFQELIEDILAKDPQLGKIVDGFMRYHNSDETYARMNEPHQEEFGMDAPRVQNYTGFRRRKGNFNSEEGSYFDTLLNGVIANRNKSLVPSSAIEAVESPLPFERADAYDNLSQSIRAVETWRAMRGAERRLRYVFNSSRVQEVIARKFGTDTLQIARNLYSSIVGTRGLQHAQRIKLIANARARFGSAFVNGKLSSALTQYVSVFNALGEIGPKDFVKGMADAVLHPAKVYKWASQTPLWKVRYKNYTTEMAERHDMQGVFGSKVDPKIIEHTATFVTAGDRATLLTAGWAVREAYRKAALLAGKTEEEATAIGDSKGQEFIDSTQSSGLPDEITHFERGGDFQKALLMFGKQPIQIFGQMLTRLRRFSANPSIENGKLLTGAIIGAHAAQAAFVTLKSMFSAGALAMQNKLDEKTQMAYLQKIVRSLIVPGQGMPIIGDLEDMALVPALNEAMGANEKAPDGISFLPLDTLSHGGKFVADINKMSVKAMQGEDVTASEIFQALDDYAEFAPVLPTTPISGGAPIRPAIKAAKMLTPAQSR